MFMIVFACFFFPKKKSGCEVHTFLFHHVILMYQEKRRLFPECPLFLGIRLYQTSRQSAFVPGLCKLLGMYQTQTHNKHSHMMTTNNNWIKSESEIKYNNQLWTLLPPPPPWPTPPPLYQQQQQQCW